MGEVVVGGVNRRRQGGRDWQVGYRRGGAEGGGGKCNTLAAGNRRYRQSG